MEHDAMKQPERDTMGGRKMNDYIPEYLQREIEEFRKDERILPSWKRKNLFVFLHEKLEENLQEERRKDLLRVMGIEYARRDRFEDARKYLALSEGNENRVNETLEYWRRKIIEADPFQNDDWRPC